MDRKYVMRYIVLISVILQFLAAHAMAYVNAAPELPHLLTGQPAVAHAAAYSYIISELIFVAFTLYAIVQITPSARKQSVYDYLSVPVVILNFLGVLKIYSNHTGLELPTLIIVLVMTVISFRSFSEARTEVLDNGYNLWLQFPFALLSAALSVTLAKSVLGFLTENLLVGQLSGIIKISMLVILMVTGLLVNYRTSSLVFPMVIAWFMVSVYGGHFKTAPAFASMALIFTLCLLVLPVAMIVSGKVNHFNGIGRVRTKTK